MKTVEQDEDLLEAYENLPGEGTVLEFLELVRKTHPHLKTIQDSRITLLWLPITWRVGVQLGSEIIVGIGDSYIPYFDTLILKLLSSEGSKYTSLSPEQSIRWEARVAGSNQ